MATVKDEPLPGLEPPKPKVRRKLKGDDVKASSCCGAPLQLESWGWRCVECRRRIPD